MPEDAKDLVDKLLKKNPEERLGSANFEDLKAHQYFKSIDFVTLRT
jgi:hypothetical protein